MRQGERRVGPGRAASPMNARETITGASNSPHEPRRALRRLRASQRYMPLLVVVALLSTFGLAGITYIGARANTIASAQTRTLQDAQVARQLIADQGANLTLHNGQLVVGVDNSVYTLNGDSTLVDRTRSLVGGYATIYELEGSNLIAIASDLPGRSGPPLGVGLTGAPYDALLGDCGAVDSPSCHQPYTGVVTLRGVDYVAGFLPLTDASGAFVGALGVALPLGDELAPVNQLSALLVLVGLLLSFLCILGGSWFFGARSEQMLTTLDTRLGTLADSASALERLAQVQVERATQQGRAARQVSEQARALDALAGAMEHGQMALRESAGGIWQEMSQPGAAPDPQAALQWARQAAVVSSRVGTAAERSRDVCRQLIALMNHIVAEGGVVTSANREMREHAHTLRESVEGVEMAVGERLINRLPGMAGLPLIGRVRRILTSRSLSRRAAATLPGESAARGARDPQRSGSAGSRGPWRGGDHGPMREDLSPPVSRLTDQPPRIHPTLSGRSGIRQAQPQPQPRPRRTDSDKGEAVGDQGHSGRQSAVQQPERYGARPPRPPRPPASGLHPTVPPSSPHASHPHSSSGLGLPGPNPNENADRSGPWNTPMSYRSQWPEDEE